MSGVLDDLFGPSEPLGSDPFDDFSLPDLQEGTYARQVDPLPLGAVLLDPKHNVSRDGVVDPPSHPDVQKITRSLCANGSTLVHCVGLRPLVEPIKRPCGRGPCCSPEAMKRDGAHVPTHTHEARYGFRRLTALAATGRTHLSFARNEVKLLVEDDGTPWSTQRCEDANIAENTARGAPTEFQLSMAVAECYRRGESVESIAAKLDEPPSAVCDRVLIVERCPAQLKAAWARRPTKDVARVLAKIARTVDPDDRWPLEKRHAAMVEAWAQYEAECAATTARLAAPPAQQHANRAGAVGPAAPAPPWLGRRKRGRSRTPGGPAAVSALRDAVDAAAEVRDPSGDWRPITPGERAFAQALLAALARGDSGGVLR